MGTAGPALAGGDSAGQRVTPERRLSASDAEKVLGIPASTVRSWYRRRRNTGLYEIGLDGRNHPLFYESDLLALRRGERLRDEHGQRMNGDTDVG